MKLVDFSDSPSIIDQYMHELRDINIQKDRARFRNNLEKIGEIMAYEISKELDYTLTNTITSFGSKDVQTLKDQVVLATIFRAGLPVHAGFLRIFSEADSALIGASRHTDQIGNSYTKIDYDGSANIDGKVLIVIDTMLATGVTISDVFRLLLTHGQPKRVIFAGIIASERAVNYIAKHLPDTEVYLASIDPKLNGDLYIVPGLGDAGDLIYGTKIS